MLPLVGAGAGGTAIVTATSPVSPPARRRTPPAAYRWKMSPARSRRHLAAPGERIDAHVQRRGDEAFVDVGACPLKIGQRAGDPPDAMKTAATEPVQFELAPQQCRRARCYGRQFIETMGGDVGVAGDAASRRPFAGGANAFGDDGRGLAELTTEQFVDGGPLDFETKVEAVEQRAGYAAEIAGAAVVATLAGARLSAPSAGTRVHGGDQQEPSREVDRGTRPCHPDQTLLQRFAQPIENRGRELGQLVEEQHTSMGATHFAGTHGGGATTDH